MLEAGSRLLPALSDRISVSAEAELAWLGVDVRTNTAVTKAIANGLVTKDGETIFADLMVWAAASKLLT